MDGIGDLDNSGRNRLVIRMAQSDVSPGRYDFLGWQNGKLVKEQSEVSFDEKDIQVSGFISGFYFSEYLGKKVLKAGLYGVTHATETLNGQSHIYETGGKSVYGIIKNGKFVIEDIE